MSTLHLQLLAGLALLIALGLAFTALFARLNDRRAVDRDEADQWNYGP